MTLKQPLIVPVTENRYELFANYEYIWVDGQQPHMIAIAKGFRYDGASVPQIAWSLTGIRPDGLLRDGALIHDFMYRYKGDLPHGTHLYQGTDGLWKFHDHKWTRKDADKMLRRLMLQAGVSSWKARAAYMAVRLFGWRTW